jgi:hypothetical protein
MELIDILNEYWAIILTIISIVISFTTLKIQNQDQERRIKCVEDKIEELNPIWVEIKERLASIEATLKFLTKNNP